MSTDIEPQALALSVLNAITVLCIVATQQYHVRRAVNGETRKILSSQAVDIGTLLKLAELYESLAVRQGDEKARSALIDLAEEFKNQARNKITIRSRERGWLRYFSPGGASASAATSQLAT